MNTGRPLGALVATFLALGPGAGNAQDSTFFRIASGPPGGAYFPISGTIAQVISNPPGAQACERGGNCGVPGLLAISQSAEGSVANAKAVAEGRIESAFVQSDVAYWAHSGTGPFKGQKPLTNLRIIASLYPEPMQVFAATTVAATDIRGLKGKRVAMGSPEAGSFAGIQMVFKAYGLSEKSGYKALSVQERSALDMLRDGKADALVEVGGVPLLSLTELARSPGGRLLPVDGKMREAVLKEAPYYMPARIPGGTYAGNPDNVETVAASALWITRADIPATLVHDIAKALFVSQTARRVLNSAHPLAQNITLATALDGVAIPLHAGAERFYREAGLFAEEAAETTAESPAAPQIQ
ncbi:MAG: TAXI family TRAP transporter solute-binding subunit [Alphaproteobacteria bacterium]